MVSLLVMSLCIPINHTGLPAQMPFWDPQQEVSHQNRRWSPTSHHRNFNSFGLFYGRCDGLAYFLFLSYENPENTSLNIFHIFLNSDFHATMKFYWTWSQILNAVHQYSGIPNAWKPIYPEEFLWPCELKMALPYPQFHRSLTWEEYLIFYDSKYLVPSPLSYRPLSDNQECLLKLSTPPL